MNPREKKPDFSFTYIALGLVLGFFLGSGIVYWYSNRQNDSIFSRNLWDYFARVFQGESEPDTYLLAEDSPRQPSGMKPPTGLPESNPGDTLSLAGMPADATADSLALDTVPEADDADILAGLTEEVDLPGDPGIPRDNLPERPGNIHIAKDSLLEIRAFTLPNQTPDSERDPALRKLDSLLGNYPRKDRTENVMIVEFWLSPLNFRGYKMSRNKIIVYGLDQLESFSLHSNGNSYFIKYFEDYYPVSLTLDFKPLVPVNDPGLLEETQERWQ